MVVVVAALVVLVVLSPTDPAGRGARAGGKFC